jgi:hypothetical protein
MEGSFVWVNRKSAFSYLYEGGFFVVSQEAFKKLVLDEDLVGRPWQVFTYLLTKLDFDNYIQLSQQEVCEALGLRKENVSRYIKLLCDKGILIRGPKVGHANSYRLDPNFGYKGDPRGKVHRMAGGRGVAFEVIEGALKESE